MTNSKGITFEKGVWYYCPTFDEYFCYAMDSGNGVWITAKIWHSKYTVINKDTLFATKNAGDGNYYYEITNDDYINDAEPANMSDVEKFINPE